MINKNALILFLFSVGIRIHHSKAASVPLEDNGQLIQTSNAEDKDLQCGGVHEAVTEPSILSYKFNQPMEKYESCVWTLNAANRSLIKINVTDILFHGTDQQYLAVGFFNKSNYDQVNFFTWIKLPTIYSSQTVEVPGPVVFLHFVSVHSSEVSFGFRLTFEAGGEEQSSIYNFENYFFGGQYGKFRYPPHGGSYKNNQRVTIVVKANSGLPVQGNPYPSYINIINKGIETSEGCLVDNLNIYSFGEGSQTWHRNASLCGPAGYVAAPYFINPRNDPMILTFKSDDSGVDNGFYLLWMNHFYQ